MQVNLKNKKRGLIELLSIFLVAGIILILAFTNSDTQNKTSPEVFYPESNNYVMDSANVLDIKTIEEIVDLVTVFEEKAQIAVVTIESTQPLTIEEYSIKLAEKWRVGRKGKDNGIIFLVAVKDRKARIEVGSGLEAVINDAKAGRILDQDVIPHLKNDDWDSGALGAVKAIIKEVNKK